MMAARRIMPETIDRLPPVRGRLRADVDLAPSTWFRVGGPAEFLFRPADIEDLAGFLAGCPEDIPVTVLGVASNLLIRDGGLEGVVVRLGGSFASVRVEDAKVIAGAGALDLTVAQEAQAAGLGGLEFLSGIPGTIGGAVKMNAGAYGREIVNVIESAMLVTRTGKIVTVPGPALGLNYRHSDVADDAIVVKATLRGMPEDAEAIAARMQDIQTRRAATQPIRARTGGSTFANPPGAKAWELIDQAGCRGLTIGGAQVSEQHCNFLINTGGATAAELESLGEEVRRRVHAASGIMLAWEIKRIGGAAMNAAVRAMNLKRVTVLLGGWSAEREVSLVSGRGVADALQSRGHVVTAFDPPCDLIAVAQGLSPAPDVVFNALHGTGGEDGTIQAMLDILGIPYTHSGMRASAVAMDKPMAKRLVATVGVPSPKGVIATPAELAKGHPIPPPYVVKPVAEGSSVGVAIVRDGANATAAVSSWSPDEDLLVEPYIPGRELTVGVMSRPGEDARALAVTEIVYTTETFDYTAKYSPGHATHVLPAEIPQPVYQAALEYARAAHEVIGCTGVTRSDFRWDDSRPGIEGLYFLEINTQPGMTPISLVPEQAALAGMSYADLVEWIVEGGDMPPLNPSTRTVRRQPKKHAGLLRWTKRGLKAAVVFAVISGGVMAWRSGRLQATWERVAYTSIVWSAKGGFRVENVEVVGRSQTEPKTLLAAAGLRRGDPILAFSPAEARQRIEALPWVQSAAVERRLPDTVAITIVERKPIALWQHNEKISLIDAAGAVLGTVAIEMAPNLPLIVGGDAPAHASELLTLLAAYPDIGKRVQASSWIGSRRWDLKLDNGVDIRLPETGVADAMKQLAEAEASSRLLERDVAAVDLRLSGKMIVRLAHELPPPSQNQTTAGNLSVQADMGTAQWQ